MIEAGSGRLLAVIDTSFWTAAYRAEIIANRFDLYTIVVPPAVDREILAPQAAFPRREYPYATLFRHLRGQMTDAPASAPPLDRFGAGEGAAISLAREMGALLMINERRAATYAREIGLHVVTVPAVIVDLTMLEVISPRAAHRKLDLIAPITAEQIVAEARRTLDWLVDVDELDQEPDS